MFFILLSSIVTLHNPYFHEIALPINTGHGKFSFVFDKLNIFTIISLEDRWRSGNKQELTLFTLNANMFLF